MKCQRFHRCKAIAIDTDPFIPYGLLRLTRVRRCYIAPQWKGPFPELKLSCAPKAVPYNLERHLKCPSAIGSILSERGRCSRCVRLAGLPRHRQSATASTITALVGLRLVVHLSNATGCEVPPVCWQFLNLLNSEVFQLHDKETFSFNVFCRGTGSSALVATNVTQRIRCGRSGVPCQSNVT